jgi:peptidoglycan hydrolase-like protein with peptidoglycan-binding domain
MEPPPYVPTLADLPLPLADAFERAFGPVGATGARPDGKAWVTLLHKLESELVRCPQNAAHHFFRVASSCPWCRMERAFPGFLAFVPTVPIVHGPRELGQLIAAVRGIPDPGPAPDLGSLMPALPDLKPSQAAQEVRTDRIRSWIVGLIGTAVGLGILSIEASGLLRLLVFGTAGVLLFKAHTAYVALRNTIESARTAWANVERAFEQTAGNAEFRKHRESADTIIRQLQLLFDEERRRLDELNAKRRDAQLRQHLERHLIDQLSIKGVGAARKAMLKAYGVESAADVEWSRIERIPGFGPSTTDALIAWRRKVESTFVFNQNLKINPIDVAAIKADIGRRQIDLEGRLRQIVLVLKKAVVDAKALRTAPGVTTVSAWKSWKQAEIDAGALKVTGKDVARLVPFGFLGLAVFTFITLLGSQSISPVGQPPSRGSTPVLRPLPSQDRAPARTTEAAHTPPSGQSQLGTTTSPPRLPSATADPAPPAPAPTPLEIETPKTAVPQELAPVPPLVADLDILAREDAARVQQRLAELGYYNGIADGVWGPRSRNALREFRRAQGLGTDDRWDSETQAALMSERASRANALTAPPAPPAPIYTPEPQQTRQPEPPRTLPLGGATRQPSQRQSGADAEPNVVGPRAASRLPNVPSPQVTSDACDLYRRSPTTYARCKLLTGPDAYEFVPLIGRNHSLDTQLRCHAYRMDEEAYSQCLLRR